MYSKTNTWKYQYTHMFPDAIKAIKIVYKWKEYINDAQKNK